MLRNTNYLSYMFNLTSFYRFVAETIGVSNSGSQISVINGQTGQYMVRRTQSVATAFEALRNVSGSCNIFFNII